MADRGAGHRGWVGREAPLAERFLGHYETLRGVVRHELLSRQLDEHLPSASCVVVDVGGGAGLQALRLARAGHRVTVVDPAHAMLAAARLSLAEEIPAVQDRITLLEAAGEDAVELLGSGVADVVCCHGVLAYQAESRPLVSALVELARPGGIISVLVKNRAALAMRPALEGRYDDARNAFDAGQDIGGLGISTRADSVDSLSELLHERGAAVIAWYGIRVFTDHLGDVAVPENLPAIVDVEEQAGRRDPYRHVARMIHVVGRKHNS